MLTCLANKRLAIRFLVPLCLLATHASRADEAAVLWARGVQPLLDRQCVNCHGPLEQKAGLELDTPEAVLKGGDDGPVLTPGKPEASSLWLNLAASAESHMPPKKQLSDAEIERVREWIAALGGTPAPPPAAPATVAFTDISTAVDHYVAEGWKKTGVTPAEPASDAAWCRRVFLDLAGRLPNDSELTSFLSDSAPQGEKRAKLADRLLAAPEFAAHQRDLWDVFLMGRGKRDNTEERRSQAGWHRFLETAFAQDRPWDAVVRDLLAARATTPESKGASWFLYERRNDHQKIAEAVAPVIYGAKVDCAQCHDHPLAREIRQGHYWGLVTAYSRSRNVEGTHELAESAVGGFQNFTNLKKESQPAVVSLLTGKTLAEIWPESGVETLDPSALEEEKEKKKKERERQRKAEQQDRDELYVDAKAKVRVPRESRRQAFAEAATSDNPLLARAFVNRVWALLLGRGLVHPADEMTARNVPSHPALLQWLAEDFAKNGHRPRRVFRGIVLSRAYALAPRPASAASPPPEAFAQALERPMTAEQLARSWTTVLGLPPEDAALRRAAVAALPDVLPAEYNATFQQAQFLTNDPKFSEALRPVPGGLIQRLAATPDPAQQVALAFQAAYARPPGPEELSQAQAFLQTRAAEEKNASPAIRDLMWALLTSAEFLTVP